MSDNSPKYQLLTIQVLQLREFAKRQMTWFRDMERRGFELHWVDAAESDDNKVDLILNLWK